MKKIILIVATILLTVGFSNYDDVKIPMKPNPFPFLKIGNSWVYKNASNCGVMDFGKPITVERLNYFTKFALSNGKSFTTLISILDDAPTSKNVFRTVSYSRNTYTVDMPLFWEDYFVGQRWTNPNDKGYLRERVREVISVDETLIVEAGIFKNVIKIQETCIALDGSIYNTRYWWIRNDVGIIAVTCESCKRRGRRPTELKAKNF
jgi:hypothetical protein